MSNYKIKLQPGDAVSTTGWSFEQTDEVIKRFLHDGAQESDLQIVRNQFVRWVDRDWQEFTKYFLNGDDIYAYIIKHGRLLRLSSIFALEIEERQPDPLPTRTLDQYIVWGPSGKTNPKFVHGNFDAALTEAKRMSREHCAKFHVCGIIATVKAKHVTSIETEIKFNDEEQIPF